MTWGIFWMGIIAWVFIGIPVMFFVAAFIGQKGISVSDQTMKKVYTSMSEAGVPFVEGMDAITKMHEKGIVFTEKEPSK